MSASAYIGRSSLCVGLPSSSVAYLTVSSCVTSRHIPPRVSPSFLLSEHPPSTPASLSPCLSQPSMCPADINPVMTHIFRAVCQQRRRQVSPRDACDVYCPAAALRVTCLTWRAQRVYYKVLLGQHVHLRLTWPQRLIYKLPPWPARSPPA